MTATNPQPDDPRAGGDGARPQDLRGGGRRVLLALVALVVVLVIAVSLTRCGGDDDPSGGDEQGLGTTATVQLSGAR